MGTREVINNQFNDGVEIIEVDTPERRAYINNFSVDDILMSPLNYFGQKSFHPTKAMLDEQKTLYNYLCARIASTPQHLRFSVYQRLMSRYVDWASSHGASSSFNPQAVIG